MHAGNAVPPLIATLLMHTPPPLSSSASSRALSQHGDRPMSPSLVMFQK